MHCSDQITQHCLHIVSKFLSVSQDKQLPNEVYYTVPHKTPLVFLRTRELRPNTVI